MNRMKPHERSPARVQASARHTRDYWRSTILAQALKNATLLGWLPPMEQDLGKLGAELYQRVLGKSRELLDRCCEATVAGQPQHRVSSRMCAELWNFMKLAAPSEAYESAASRISGETAELFPPHEDTEWPTANRR